MIPPCHNRPERTDPRAGWHDTGRMKVNVLRRFGEPATKPILRYRHPWFTDRCATHDGRGIGPNGESYPQAHGWDCTGCRWLPTEMSTAEASAAALLSIAKTANEPAPFVHGIDHGAGDDATAFVTVSKGGVIGTVDIRRSPARFDPRDFGVLAVDREDVRGPLAKAFDRARKDALSRMRGAVATGQKPVLVISTPNGKRPLFDGDTLRTPFAWSADADAVLDRHEGAPFVKKLFEPEDRDTPPPPMSKL